MLQNAFFVHQSQNLFWKCEKTQTKCTAAKLLPMEYVLMSWSLCIIVHLCCILEIVTDITIMLLCKTHYRQLMKYLSQAWTWWRMKVSQTMVHIVVKMPAEKNEYMSFIFLSSIQKHLMLLCSICISSWNIYEISYCKPLRKINDQTLMYSTR